MPERTYRIGEAARLLKLESFVLRYWETEFSQLQPVRTPKGQRQYTAADLQMLRHVRFLLHEQGLTIEGARRVLDGKTGVFGTSLKEMLVRPSGGSSSSLSDGSSSGDARQGAVEVSRASESGVVSRRLREVLSLVESELMTMKRLLEK